MTIPPELAGGVRDDIALGAVAEDTAALSAAMGQSMAGENGRRLLASQRPGHGAAVPLAQPPSAAGVGISDVEMPVVGLGYTAFPDLSEAQTAAYVMPRYADDSVGGVAFTAGRQEAPMSKLIAGIQQAARARRGTGNVVYVDAGGQRPRSLLGRLFGRRPR